MYEQIERLAEKLTVEQTDETHFKSKNLPLKAGNAAPISYGGFTIGIAVNAATATVPENRQLYSILGQFLSPVMVEEHITCEVISHRETRTFSSRQVKVYQRQSDGKDRMCLIALLDFRTTDTPLMVYSAQPSMIHTDVDDCPTTEEASNKLLADGHITERSMKTFKKLFGSLQSYFETKQCPESISAQNFTGLAKKIQTKQDHLPIPETTSAEWLRCHEKDTPVKQRFGNIAFIMDAGLSFLPLIHDHMFFDDCGACSTLEFAIRIWDPKPDLSKWHLRERKTIAADHGLTYSEGRLWARDGKTLVASMTQQCILRPKPQKASL